MSKGFDNVPKVLKLDKPKKNKIQFLQVIRLIHIIRFYIRLFKILIIFFRRNDLYDTFIEQS